MYEEPFHQSTDIYEEPFHIDKRSSAQAQELTKNLAFEHRFRIQQLKIGLEAGKALDDEPEEFRFTEALSGIGAEIPLNDMKSDLEDFGSLSSFAEEFKVGLPVVSIDKSLPPIPLLPPRDSGLFCDLEALRSSPHKAREALKELMQNPSPEGECKFLPRGAVEQTFFNSLRGFLACRIAGVRWARKIGLESSGAQLLASSSGGGGFSGGGGGGRSTDGDDEGDEFQKWTITTQGEGYSIYYAGTHVCRKGAIYLNAPTSPIDVYLPMGTVRLAANAGAGGDHIWDNSIIVVPNRTPNFQSKVF